MFGMKNALYKFQLLLLLKIRLMDFPVVGHLQAFYAHLLYVVCDYKQGCLRYS